MLSLAGKVEVILKARLPPKFGSVFDGYSDTSNHFDETKAKAYLVASVEEKETK
jgi:hypothetical protein